MRFGSCRSRQKPSRCVYNIRVQTMPPTRLAPNEITRQDNNNDLYVCRLCFLCSFSKGQMWTLDININNILRPVGVLNKCICYSITYWQYSMIKRKYKNYIRIYRRMYAEKYSVLNWVCCFRRLFIVDRIRKKVKKDILFGSFGVHFSSLIIIIIIINRCNFPCRVIEEECTYSFQWFKGFSFSKRKNSAFF